MVAQNPINHNIFSKSVMRTFIGMHVIALTDLNFLLRSARKINFFGQFKDLNSGKKHGKCTNNPIFIYFFCTNDL